MRYRVTALYDYPPVERSTIVVAENPQRAMVQALIEGHLPTGFKRDANGWLEPQMWHLKLAGANRWPRVLDELSLAWGEEGAQQSLKFYVTEAD